MDLSDFFITKAQASDFSSGLSNVIDSIYTVGFDLEKSLVHQFGMNKKDKLLKLFRENNISITSAQAIDNFLKKMKETISSLPLVSIVIAFEPTSETLSTLSQWFIFNLKKQFIFDVQVNKQLIAGTTITYNGKFKDYSIAPYFRDILLKTSLQKESSNQLIPPTDQAITHGSI